MPASAERRELSEDELSGLLIIDRVQKGRVGVVKIDESPSLGDIVDLK